MSGTVLVLDIDGVVSLATPGSAQPWYAPLQQDWGLDPAAILQFVAAINAKYSTDYDVDFFTSPDNVCFRIRAVRVIGLDSADFTGSPTRWDLD